MRMDGEWGQFPFSVSCRFVTANRVRKRELSLFSCGKDGT